MQTEPLVEQPDDHATKITESVDTKDTGKAGRFQNIQA